MECNSIARLSFGMLKIRQDRILFELYLWRKKERRKKEEKRRKKEERKKKKERRKKKMNKIKIFKFGFFKLVKG